MAAWVYLWLYADDDHVAIDEGIKADYCAAYKSYQRFRIELRETGLSTLPRRRPAVCV